MDIYNILNKENIKPKTYGISSQKLKCPKCQPPHNPKDSPLTLTISSDGVVWYCHHCEFTGGTNMKNDNKYEKPKININAKPTLDIYEFFNKRSISKQIVDEFKILSEKGWIAFQYFDEKGELANVKYRTVDKQFRQTPNTKKILYNLDNIYKKDEIIFVEGEMDVLSLAEIGYKNATTLPNGAPKEAKFDKDDARFKALENSNINPKKVILFTDNDSSGIALHKELLHRFGKDICWYVKLPAGCKDANEYLIKHGHLKLKELVESAIPYPVDGLYTAKDYYDQVLDLYNGNYVKPYEIGLGAIDDIYKIMTSTFHVITGIPNHGKSVFLDQILLNLAKKHNFKFAIFSPEHSTSMHIRRLLQMHTKKNFDLGTINRMEIQELNDGIKFIQKHFYFIETKDAVPDLDLILDISKSSVLKYGINGIIIDPFNEVSAVRSGNKREDEHIRDFISKCKRFARTYETVMWVVAHPTKLPKNNDGSYMPPTAYDISGAAHWHNQADAVLTVYRDFDDNTTKIITRKIREQGLYGKIGEATYIFDLKTNNFIEQTISDDDWNNFYRS